MSNIIGEGFETFVSEQIKARQKILGNINKTNEEIIWENSKTSFVKLVSSADITNFTIFGGGFTEGKQLAEKYVLFNGVTDEIPTTNPGIENFQRSGIDTSGAYSNMGAYGLGGTQWGLQPMPGIISADIKSEAMGSLRTGTVQIKANNKGQFDIISTLYLRIGYTMLLEWGNTSYFDNGGNYITDNITSLADSFLSKKYNHGYIKDELGSNVTYNNLLTAVSIQQKFTDGNYDALIGRVVNFSWVFNRDGSYTITIILRSAGDVIESLTSNILLPGTVTPSGSVGPTIQDTNFNLREALAVGPSPSPETTIVSFAQSSTIGAKFAEIQKLIPIDGYFSQGKGGFNSYSTPGSKFVDYFSQRYLGSGQTQYFVRFGTFLQLLEDSVIPVIENGNEKILGVGNTNSSQILIYSPPKQIPSDPRICAFKKEIEGKTIYPDASNFIINHGNNTYGKLMFCYFNMVFILELLEDLKDENGSVSLISLLNGLLAGFCKATGNFNNITTKVNYDTLTIIFIDSTALPDRNTILTSQGKNTTSAQFNVYGLETNTNGSIVGGSFIRDMQLKTEITPDLATLITIGSTAGGYVTGTDAIAMSNLTKGTKDRIKPKILSPSNTKRQSEEENQKTIDTYQTSLDAFNQFLSLITVSTATVGPNETLPTWNEDAFSNFTSTQRQLLEYDQKQSTTSARNLDNPYAASPNSGFLPFNLTLTMDGLSGMKIFNKYNIDSTFLPENYPNSMEFVIMNISHTIQNNIWITNITSAAIPNYPIGTKPGEKSQSSPTKTTQQGGKVTTQEETNTYLIDLLKALGLPSTEGNILFFKAWRQFEAGKASWNAFNTTYNIGVTSNYNGIGVKNYSSRENGIQANAQTFKRKDYQPLLEKLKNVKTIQDAYNVAVLESDGPKGGGLYIWSQGYYAERARQCKEYAKSNKGNLTQKQIDNIVKYNGCPVLETVANTYVASTLKGWINSGFTTASQATITNLIYKA
jgi:hypothetical protein